MGLTFLNPALLWGLGAAAIPLLIHLLQKRRFQVVRWGAMEFLRVSAQKRSRRLKLEQLLLLLLRTLLIAVVMLAISRPVLHSRGMAASAAREPVLAVLILDDSYSMAYRPQGAKSAFEQARERALEYLQGNLRRGDAVSVVLASDPPRLLIGKPSYDLPGVAARIRGLKLTDRGTDYGKAARLALEVLESSKIRDRQVLLVGDNQATAWTGQKKDPNAWEALSRRAHLVMVPVREGNAPNAAVESVRLVRGLVTNRTPARIEARVANFSTQSRSGLLATLEVDGKPQGSAQKLDLEPHGTGLARFQYLFDRPGVHACAVRVSSDRLPADDTGYLSVRVRKNVRALVVDGAPNQREPEKDAAFFLQVALAPPALAGEEPVPLEPTVVNEASFTAKRLHDFDLVVLSNVPVMDSESRRELGQFLQAGGGVLIFLGDRVDPGVYNGELLDSQPKLLPARLGSINSSKVTFDPASFQHPALARFRQAQDIDLNTAEFTRHFQLSPDGDDRTVHVMARFTGGAPALVEKQFGLGRLILVAGGATPAWGTLPLKPAFLPLVQQLAAYLASAGEGNRNVQVGERVTKRLPLAQANTRISVAEPDGGRRTLRPHVTADGALASVEDLGTAGFYRMTVEGAADEADVVAVNRDTSESDLRSLDQTELRRVLPVGDWTWVPPGADLLTTLRKSRQGMELWRYLLFAAMALMALESLVAQKVGGRR